MRIWIPKQDHPAIAAAVVGFGQEHEVVTDVLVDLCDPEQVEAAIAGADLVLHDAIAPANGVSDEVLLDHAARSAYVILHSAIRAEVSRAVLVSNLACFDDVPFQYVIDESWRPMPRPDARSLAPLMVERTFREFARQGPIETICLRFGDLDSPGGTPIDLAAEAIQRALTAPIGQNSYRWWLFHVADSPRFSMSAARGGPLHLGKGT